MKKILVFLLLFVSILLLKSNVYAYQEYKVGDLIKYRDEYWFVIEDTKSYRDYVTLLKYEPITKDEINQYNSNLNPTDNGEVLYSNTEIFKLLNNWSSDFSDDLISVDGYKVRLINDDDLIENLKYDYGLHVYTPSNQYFEYSKTNETLEFQGAYKYWTMITQNDSDYYTYYIDKDTTVRYDNGATYYGERVKNLIRPVINLNKNLMNTCTYKYDITVETKNNKMNRGSGFSLNNESYDVLIDSDESQDYVTVLKYSPLTQEEIFEYSNGIYNNASIPYYSSDDCTSNTNHLGCVDNYNQSNIKPIIERWADEKIGDKYLREVDGYKVRLVNEDDILKNGLVFQTIGSFDERGYISTRDSYYFIYNNWSYWTMAQVSDSNEEVFNVELVDRLDYRYGARKKKVYNESQVRPVVNLDKCSIGSWTCTRIYNINIDDECSLLDDNDNKNNNKTDSVCKEGINYKTEQIKHNKSFRTGKLVMYNDDLYRVLYESDENTNYVTLLKEKPLTVDELYKYGRDENDHLFINEYAPNIYDSEKVVYEYTDGSGGMAFYTSDTCSYEREWYLSYFIQKNMITSGCVTSYELSDVKKVIDSWSNDKIKNEDLVEIDGYTVRLLTIDELQENFGLEYKNYISFYGYEKSSITPNWLIKNYSYWTMSPRDDSEYQMLAVGSSLATSGIRQYAVRPVVNVDKCAIEGGCEIEEIIIDDGCIEDVIENKNVVKGDNVSNNPIMSVIVGVENTLKNRSLLVMIICSILIISGLSMYIYNYKKIRKINKDEK